MKKVYSAFCVISGLLLLSIVILSFLINLNINGSKYSKPIDLNTGWVDESGNEAVMFGPKFTKTSGSITREVTSDELNGRAICFRCSYVYFTIYLNDEEVYDFHPRKISVCGDGYGHAIVQATLPDFNGSATLKIKYKTVRSDSNTGFEEVVAQPSVDNLLHYIRKYLLAFTLSAIPFVYGMLIILIGVIVDHFQGMQLPIISLGLISCTISTWTGSQTPFLSILSGNPSLIRMSEYISLMILPIPVLIFAAYITSSERNNFLLSGVLLAFINTFVQLNLVAFDIADYGDLVFIDHFVILYGIAMIVITFIEAWKKKKLVVGSYKLLRIALFVLFFSAIGDLIRYYTGIKKDLSAMTKVGLIVFVTLLSISLFRELVKIKVESSESEKMRNMALHDALTGLKSRQAFVEDENSIRKETAGYYLFIHFDVNFLKKVNDNYGHAEGDKHIIAAGRAIKTGFGQGENVYRVGGDEFFAVLKERSEEKLMKTYKTGEEKFYQFQKDYNSKNKPPVILAIAHGCAVYKCSEANDPENAEKRADQRMYENKKAMKEKMKAAMA